MDWDRISDDPDGDGSGAPRAEVIGTIALGETSVPVRLTRARDGAWRFGRGVVDAIPRMYAAYGPGWIGDRMPPVLIEIAFLDVQAWQWIGLVAALFLAVLVAGPIGAVGRRVALRLVRRTPYAWDEQLVRTISAPGRLLLAAVIFALGAHSLHLALHAERVVDHLVRILGISGVCWAGLRLLRFTADVLDGRLSHGGDEAAARSRRTQVMVLRRIAGFVVIVASGALVLLQFDVFRAIGTSLLASASVAGILVGLAAQRSLATVLAGLQLSLTQPVRVGDLIVVDGESGTVEEITLTYVVVLLWDLRRLVVPITKFLDAPFQNWSRSGTDLLGTVLVHADYRVPVDAVRRELERFVATRREWDKRTVGLQVTNATDRTIELRALVSSADSSVNWDLRCAVREHLVEFLQRLEDGRFLPRTRLEGLSPAPARNEVVSIPDTVGRKQP